MRELRIQNIRTLALFIYYRRLIRKACWCPYLLLIQGIVLKVKVNKYRPRQAFKARIFQDNRHMNVVNLSALHTGRLYPHEISLVFVSVRS